MSTANPEREMPFLEHVQELRSRLIFSLFALLAGAIAAFIFYDEIIVILSYPFKDLDSSVGEEKLFVNSIIEPFLIKLKVTLLSGLVVSFPIHIYNILRFVFPGLRPVEKRVVLGSLLVSAVLIITGSIYSYRTLIPLSIDFLMSISWLPKDVGIMLNYGKSIFYIFNLLLFSMVLFQLPIILEFLMISGLVKRKKLLASSRYVIIGIFILSAVLTPPDPVSQLGVALPLIIFFYLTILIAKIFRFGE